MTTSIENVHVAVALVRDADNRVLMVKHQGEDDPAPYWALPGGMVEAGETPHAALIREVAEETGLHITTIGNLCWMTRTHDLRDDERLWIAQTYAITAWEGTIAVDDPDGEVLEAAFVPLAEALTELDAIAYRPMREPPIAYLNATARAGTIWHYEHTDPTDAQLLRRVHPDETT